MSDCELLYIQYHEVYVTLRQAFSHTVVFLLGVMYMYVPRLNFNTNYFVLLRRKLCCCRYSTIVFVLISVNVMVSTHLCVVFHHFRCPMSLFQDHIACWNLSQQGLSVCMSPRYSCLSG